MKRFYILVFITLFACNNLDDVSPSNRNTFYHFYGGVNNFRGVAAEQVSDGYVILGDSLGLNNNSSIVVIKTDTYGKTVWRRIFRGGSSNSFFTTDDGYLVIGDSIQIDLTAEQVNDQVKRKMRLIKLTSSGGIGPDKSFGSFSLTNRVDYKGHAVTKVGDSIYSIGSVRLAGAKARAIISSHKASDFSVRWTKNYNYDNRDYLNSKSVHVTKAGQIIWATSASLDLVTTNRSYLAVPVLTPNSTFDNNALFGRNEDLYYSGSDIKPSATGYGIIGTYQSITGANSNIYFVKTDPAGNITAGSDKYFDGELSADNTSLKDKNTSNTQDIGSAIIATSDGGFLLAGSMTTTTVRGNGGLDAFFIRIDPAGNVIWNKIIGGTGDETVGTVRQTSDGGFLVCGTATLGGLSSIYVLKMNKDGDLKD